MKKKLSLIVAMILVLSTIFSMTAFAASYPSLSSSSYCEFTAAKSISVWRNSSCTTRGTSNPAKSYNASISQNDVCYIYSINSSYAQINYPTSSGRKTGYIKTSDLLGSSVNPSSSFTASSKVTTLKYKNGAESGYYASGDKVYKISGANYNVMYTAKSGNRAYKLAYANTTSTSTSTTQTATVTYCSHVQDIGWMGWQTNGATSGTTGRNLRVEAFQMKLSGVSGNISYRAHVQDIGWMSSVSNGATAGTTGKCLRIEAFQVTLSGAVANSYDVVYRAHVQDIGWMDWVSNGQIAGTTGRSLKIEAIQIKLVKKGSTSSSASTTASSSTWQCPMKNAYCTWSNKTDMSWSGYYYRGNNRTDHLGIDIYGTNGTVYAAASGTVVACSSSNSGANGRYIIIQHTLNGKTIYSFYAHLASLNVSKGSTVSTSTKIGVAGGSGNGKNDNYGTHLHFAIVDTLWSNGGYYGYATSFTGNKKYYDGVTYYNPIYIISNNNLP